MGILVFPLAFETHTTEPVYYVCIPGRVLPTVQHSQFDCFPALDGKISTVQTVEGAVTSEARSHLSQSVGRLNIHSIIIYFRIPERC